MARDRRNQTKPGKNKTQDSSRLPATRQESLSAAFGRILMLGVASLFILRLFYIVERLARRAGRQQFKPTTPLTLRKRLLAALGNPATATLVNLLIAACTLYGTAHIVRPTTATPTPDATGKPLKKAPALPAMKVVDYDGSAVTVPAIWPVYDLSKDPHQCVRYDVHAVYLGTPGANQNCPANLIGETSTISIDSSGKVTSTA
jgi:hypothetical protein